MQSTNIFQNMDAVFHTDPRYPRISEGNYYEAHQQLRVVASRYVKSSDWDSAIDILYGGALALLKAGQGGSGADLGCFLVEVLDKADKSCGAGEKGAFESVVVEANERSRGDRRLADEKGL